MTAHPRARLFVVALVGALLTLITGVGASSAGPPAGSTAARDATLTATPLAVSGAVTASKAHTSRLAKTDPALLGRTDRTPVRVVIKLDYDSIATYQGELAGLPATSPTVTGTPLTGASRAELRYGAYVARAERAIVADIQQSVPRAEIGESLRTVYGGVTAEIPANRVAAVLAIDGVIAVQKDALRQPLTDSSPAFVDAPGAYSALGTTANAGEGVIYGNLDTGIWPEHPSFADLGNLNAPAGPARECNYGDNPLTPAVDVFACQNKLIGGDHQTNNYDVVFGDDPYAGIARDGDGHGTHTSSTSAGNIVEDVEALGRDLPAIQGLAPGAWVMEYKVCGPQGCLSSDSARAVGQAILDGVDVINFSISGGEQPFSDPTELAFLDAYAAGVFVSASAGNNGPGAGTANHLSPWTTSVGASTQTREFATTLSLTATGGDTFTVDGASITAGAGPLPVVLAQSLPGYPADCGTPAPAGAFAGKIVACRRGGQARVWKGFMVLQGGAAGMVLYNPALADVETDNHWVPTVHLADGTSFLAFMASHAGVVGSFAQGEPQPGQGDVMAAFSSRGPGGLVIKPDLTAPGVQILAGASPTPPAPDPVNGGSPPGNLYQAIAGTSMSSPHVAGAGILVRAVHPTWTPGQVRSALMTTAVTDVVKEDLTTPADPFDMGAGRIDIGNAILAPLTFDETAANFFALGNDPLNAAHLNLPSINAPVMPGRLVTNRVATNTSGGTEKFSVSSESPAGSSITVTPTKFKLQPGASQVLAITIASDAALGTQQFGEIQISSNAGDLHVPVAWIRRQGSVELSQNCVPATIPVNGLTRVRRPGGEQLVRHAGRGPGHVHADRDDDGRRGRRRRAARQPSRAEAQRDVERRVAGRPVGRPGGQPGRVHPAGSLRGRPRPDRRRGHHQLQHPVFPLQRPDVGHDRRRLQRLPDSRRRHRGGQQLLQPPGRRRSGSAEQHPGAVLDGSRRHRGCRDLRGHPHGRGEHLDRHRVAGGRLRHQQQPPLPGLARYRRDTGHLVRVRPGRAAGRPGRPGLPGRGRERGR